MALHLMIMVLASLMWICQCPVAVNRIGVNFGGSPGTWPSIFEKCLCFHQLLPPLSSPIFWFSPNIFDKSTPVVDCNLITCVELIFVFCLCRSLVREPVGMERRCRRNSSKQRWLCLPSRPRRWTSSSRLPWFQDARLQFSSPRYGFQLFHAVHFAYYY